MDTLENINYYRPGMLRRPLIGVWPRRQRTRIADHRTSRCPLPGWGITRFGAVVWGLQAAPNPSGVNGGNASDDQEANLVTPESTRALESNTSIFGDAWGHHARGRWRRVCSVSRDQLRLYSGYRWTGNSCLSRVMSISTRRKGWKPSMPTSVRPATSCSFAT